MHKVHIFFVKWDACWEDIEIEVSSIDDEITIDFDCDTAWSFPMPWLLDISKRYPSIYWDITSREESFAYNFNMLVKDGEVIREEDLSLCTITIDGDEDAFKDEEFPLDEVRKVLEEYKRKKHKRIIKGMVVTRSDCEFPLDFFI